MNDRSNPDAFVSVYLHNGKEKTRYIGRTNTDIHLFLVRTTKPENLNHFGTPMQTNANKPLGTGVIDKILAFARKSRNRLFRVHRDLELLKWHNKLEGMGVRQWYVVCSISMMLSLHTNSLDNQLQHQPTQVLGIRFHDSSTDCHKGILR